MTERAPFRISWEPRVDITDERLAFHLECSARYPREKHGKHLHPVAVVGGAPSVIKHLEELMGWPGEIWAINSMADWLDGHGIESTLLTIDTRYIESKAKRALLASVCHPDMFKRDVRVFDMSEQDPSGISGGVTTATRAPSLAIKLGYPGAVFFGCDSSLGEMFHVANQDNEKDPIRLIVRAAGRDWLTLPEFVMQAENLAMVMRTFPDYYVNRSEGLLSAMVQDDEWEVVAVSDALKRNLIQRNGDIGLYDKPYEENQCLSG